MGFHARTPPVPSPEECERSWHNTPEQQGWHIVHTALRTDMEMLAEAIGAVQAWLDDGEPLKAWQADAIKSFWGQFDHSVLLHHQRKEGFLVPWLATRVTLPSGVVADHVTLTKQQVELTTLVRQLDALTAVADSHSLVLKLAAQFATYHVAMLEHLEAEDELVSHMWRSFTEQEERQAMRAVVKDAGVSALLDSLAPMLWHLPADEQRAFTKRSGIPWMVHWLLIRPRIRRYDRRYMQPLQHVIDGTEPTGSRGVRGSAKQLLSKQVSKQALVVNSLHQPVVLGSVA